MIKRFIPFAHANNIFEIEDSFFLNNHIKVVLTDLDNTLDNFKILHPSRQVFELKKRFDKLKIKLIILSNNTSGRVLSYANTLGIECRCHMHKPFSNKLERFLKEKCIKQNEVILIGDQLMTDVLAANGAKIKVVYTEKLTLNEPIWTRINRMFEKPIKNKLIKNNLLIDWRKRL